MRWWTGSGAALLCVLAAAVPAQAAFNRVPIDLGPGDGGSPSVVMDPAGAAHVVWGIAEELIGYCAFPRGARQCARTTTLALNARQGRPHILRRPQDGVLVVIAGRDDTDADPDESTWAFTSPDGVTWSGPAPIGLGIGEALDSAVLTGDGQAVDLLQSVTGGNLFQCAPLAGTASRTGCSAAPTRSPTPPGSRGRPGSSVASGTSRGARPGRAART